MVFPDQKRQWNSVSQGMAAPKHGPHWDCSGLPSQSQLGGYRCGALKHHMCSGLSVGGAQKPDLAPLLPSATDMDGPSWPFDHKPE